MPDPVAELYADLELRDKGFVDTLGRARNSLGQFVSSGKGGLGGAVGGVSAFQSALSGSSNTTSLFGKLLSSVGSVFGSVGSAALTVGKVTVSALGSIVGVAGSVLTSFGPLGPVIAGVLAPLGAAFAFKEAIATTTSLETALVKLAKAANFDPTQAAAFKKELFALSTTLSGVSIDQLLEIATTGAKLGIAGDDLLTYAGAVARVSAAIDDIPASQLADEIGKINTVFRLGIPGVEQLGSAIDRVADSGVSSGLGILDVTQRISGTAQAAGITAQETIALAGALLDTGTNAEAAGGSLINLITALNTVKGQKGFANVLGVSVEQFAAMVKDKPMVALEAFLEKLKSLDAAGKIKALSDIGIKGSIGGGNITKLVKQVDILQKYTGFANDEFLTLNQSTASYNAVAQTTAAQQTRLSNEFTIAKDAVGSALLPAYNSVLSSLGNITARIPELVAAFQTLFATDAVQSFSSMFSFGFISIDDIIDTAIYTIRNFDLIVQDAFTNVTGFLTNIKEGFLITFDLISARIEYVGQIVKFGADTIYNSFASMYNKVQPLLNTLLVPLRDAINFSIDKFNGFAAIVAPIFSKIAGAASAVASIIKREFNFAVSLIKSVTDQIYDLFVKLYDKIKPLFGGLVQSALGPLGTAAGAAGAVGKAALDAISGLDTGGPNPVIAPLQAINAPLPNLRETKWNFTDMADERAKIFEKIRLREQAAADKLAAEKAAADKAAADRAAANAPKPPVPPEAPGTAPGTPTAAKTTAAPEAKITSLEEFAKSLQMGALSAKDKAAQTTAAATERTAVATEQLVQQMKAPGGKAGPGYAVGPA
jgi:TP901 family phage tail tape measure protein